MNKSLFLCALLASGAGLSTASATYIYLEDFSNTANGTNFNTGWNWGGADATLAAVVVDGVGLRHEAWSESQLSATPVGNNPVLAGTPMGVPFTPFNGATSRFMYTLEVAALNLTVADLGSFEIDIRKNTNQNSVWFGIMSGTTWYFAQETLNPIVDEGVLRRYSIAATNFVEINQAYNGSNGWGVARSVSPATTVGPANFTGTESIDGYAILFTTFASQIGNMYIDNPALVAIPEPSTYAAISGLLALAGVVALRRRKSAK